MKKQKTAVAWVCSAIYIAILAAILVYIALRAAPLTPTFRESVRDFSEGWQTGASEGLVLDGISAGDFGGSVTVERYLPEKIDEDDALCFRTQNAHVTVWVDGREVYRFEGRENFTGRGYGVAFHTVGLSASDAGQSVRIRLESTLDTHRGGRIWQLCLCPGVDYVRMVVRKNLLPYILSVLIIFFGLLLLTVYFWMPNKKAMPYNVGSLSATALLLGTWCMADTSIPQLLTGQIYVIRVLDKTLIPMAVYPVICFCNSLTIQKRPVFRYIAFGITTLHIALLVCMRYAFGVDMIALNYVTYAAYVCTLLLSVVIFVDNARYCKKNGLHTNLVGIYLGSGVFAACALADILFYYMVEVRVSTHGIFSRFGLAFFFILALLQFLRWWSGERTSYERNRFVNRALQYAVSANEPEVSIRALLEYLGVELGAKRTYIFEDQNNGVWHGTHEWYAEGLQPRRPELLDVPYEGLVDVLYKVFKRDSRLIISNVEMCRKINPTLYHILKENNVERFVVGPLEINGKLIGLFGVDDAPEKNLMEISEIIRLISYFFAQLVLQRDEQKRLMRYSYYDSLTGARNRRAFSEYVETGLDVQSPYGFVMCDINGLKAANDQFGHKAGDEIIIDVAKSLIEVFGPIHVYRMGGDEFAAYGFEADEASFNADVERVKKLLEQKERSASIGAVYCAGGSMDPAQVRSEADARMYQEKKRYYESKGDRRRH